MLPKTSFLMCLLCVMATTKKVLSLTLALVTVGTSDTPQH